MYLYLFGKLSLYIMGKPLSERSEVSSRTLCIYKAQHNIQILKENYSSYAYKISTNVMYS